MPRSLARLVVLCASCWLISTIAVAGFGPVSLCATVPLALLTGLAIDRDAARRDRDEE